MISRTKPALVIAILIFIVTVALAIALFSSDDDEPEFSTVGEMPNRTEAGGDNSNEEAAKSNEQISSSEAIQQLFPNGGEASACSEAIGVDLNEGYGAILTINGRQLKDEELNVNLDESGAISNVANPTRSIGHYTFQPTADCPNGELLRTQDNVLDICVYRLEDPLRRCATSTQHRFDAL